MTDAVNISQQRARAIKFIVHVAFLQLTMKENQKNYPCYVQIKPALDIDNDCEIF